MRAKIRRFDRVRGNNPLPYPFLFPKTIFHNNNKMGIQGIDKWLKGVYNRGIQVKEGG